jgi:hypothetical protein
MQTDVAHEILEVVKILPQDDQLEILQQARTLAKKGKRPSIWDKIRAHAAEIPDEEWDRMPVDGSEQHDHYLYGTPKK